MSDYTVWQLARMAGVSDPDKHDSPGGKWLRLVADSAEELSERINDGENREDAIFEAADSLVPVYTHDRWQTFVDLAAYEEQDDSGLMTSAVENGDMTHAAGVALHQVARRLLEALLGEGD